MDETAGKPGDDGEEVESSINELEDGTTLSENEFRSTPVISESEFGWLGESEAEDQEAKLPYEHVREDGTEHLGEGSDIHVRSEWVNEDFSEFEQSELDDFSDGMHEEHIVTSDVSGLPTDTLLKVESTKLPVSATVSSIQDVKSVTQKEKSPPAELLADTAWKKITVDLTEEELAKFSVPVMKPNKIIGKIHEPKYHIWPVVHFAIEKIHHIMREAVPRFFPREFPYHTKRVVKRISMLAQYLQKKVYQMGYDRRKIITVVRYAQTNWNGHRAVVRWLWCLETDAMVIYSHQGEEFVVSAVVIGLYMD